MAKSKQKKSAGSKPSATAIDRASINEEDFGNYRIKSGRLNGNFLARAFPKANSGTQGLMAEAGGDSEVDAIANLKSLLSARDAERTAARRWDDQSAISVPTREEFVDALRQTNLSASQCAMLKAHAIAGEDGLTLISLMNAGGYKSKETAVKVLSRAGAIVADFLGAEISQNPETNGIDATRILGFEASAQDATNTLRVMHPELREAVRETL